MEVGVATRLSTDITSTTTRWWCVDDRWGAADQRSPDSSVVVRRSTAAGLAVVLRDHLTRSAIRVSNYSCCPGLGGGDVDLLVPVSMTLLAVAAEIADHPDVVSN